MVFQFPLFLWYLLPFPDLHFTHSLLNRTFMASGLQHWPMYVPGLEQYIFRLLLYVYTRCIKATCILQTEVNCVWDRVTIFCTLDSYQDKTQDMLIQYPNDMATFLWCCLSYIYPFTNNSEKTNQPVTNHWQKVDGQRFPSVPCLTSCLQNQNEWDSMSVVVSSSGSFLAVDCYSAHLVQCVQGQRGGK